MLEYTSLQFVPVVLLSREDPWLHASSLFLLTSSLLIHGTQRYTNKILYYTDRLNCLMYTIVCCYRSYEYQQWINYSVLVYDILVYYVVMNYYGWNVYIHASIHTLSALVGIRCIK